VAICNIALSDDWFPSAIGLNNTGLVSKTVERTNRHEKNRAILIGIRNNYLSVGSDHGQAMDPFQDIALKRSLAVAGACVFAMAIAGWVFVARERRPLPLDTESQDGYVALGVFDKNQKAYPNFRIASGASAQAALTPSNAAGA
jgi:hypothetical protein